MPPLDAAAWMARALALAERGRGRTTPNPLVGAVVVDPDGIVVGQGAHLQAGGPHAEVWALEAAGARARGATLYCTLEPCCHTGRTGPCVERIAAAGIGRVVTAIEDPNPRVAGGGHAWLRARGIAVETGVHAERARRQNAPFLTWMTQRRPWIIHKTTVSSDGHVAALGRAVALSGSVTNRWMHRQRAWVDAVMVGADTVLVDDPGLTARGAFRYRPLTRVVVDWRGRVSPAARLFATREAGPVIMVGLASVPEERQAAWAAAGAEVWTLPDRNVAAVMAALGERDIQSLLVEGGPTLQQAMIEAGCIDAVEWVQTPALVPSGVAAAEGLRTWRERGGWCRLRQLGPDVLAEGTWSGRVHGID